MADTAQTPVPLLWDTHATAKALGIGERTLARLVKSGAIPHLRIGRRLLFDPRDLTAWINRQKQGVQPR